MAEETVKTAEEVVVVEKAETEASKETEPVTEAAKEVAEEATTEAAAAEGEGEKVAESASFKEETNVVEELPDPERVALDELKKLVQEALNKHEFTAPPPAVKPAADEVKTDEKAEEIIEEKIEAAIAETDEPKPAEEVSAPPATAVEAEEEKKEEEAVVATPEPVAEPVVEKAKEVAVTEEVKETIVEVVTPAEAEEVVAPVAEETVVPAVEETPIPPEEVSIWGIPLLADERTDVVLLKFLRARDFKVKEAFNMLKSVVAWRKEFGIDALIDEDLGLEEQEKAVYMHGFDKEGHPVCYNVYGEYSNKDLYQNTFTDEEKRTKFLRWRIQFLEKSIRKLDFSPDGICTFVQVIDLKNSPGLFKREVRQATNQALQLLQDNYPEFVAKQVFINVPWWSLAFYRMINTFFTQRTKSKFVFAGPSKSAETLFKYIAPEFVPVQYGGLSREGEVEFTVTDAVSEDTIKPAAKHTIEVPVSEASVLVWEARVLGWDVTYGAEFVPAAEDSYTIIVQKSRKLGPADEPVISSSFKITEAGKMVITFDNQTSKKKKLLYRTKTKPLAE